jgi:hypothetical protein
MHQIEFQSGRRSTGMQRNRNAVLLAHLQPGLVERIGQRHPVKTGLNLTQHIDVSFHVREG